MKRFITELVAELIIFELCWKGTHKLVKKAGDLRWR